MGSPGDKALQNPMGSGLQPVQAFSTSGESAYEGYLPKGFGRIEEAGTQLTGLTISMTNTHEPDEAISLPHLFNNSHANKMPSLLYISLSWEFAMV